jgi:hypothetical protein
VLGALAATRAGAVPPPPAPAVPGLVAAACVAAWEYAPLNGSVGIFPGFTDGAIQILLNYSFTYANVSASPSPSPVPACKADFYMQAYGYMSEDFAQLGAQCAKAVARLSMQQFGPPSSFEVFQVACLGACRRYMAHWFNLQEAARGTGCACETQIAYGEFYCPKSVNALLCRHTGFCYNETFYEQSTCAAGACGRFATNEKDYRAARAACGVAFDAAHTPAISAAAGALALVGTLALMLKG